MHWSKNPEMKAMVLEKLSKTSFSSGHRPWNAGKNGWYPTEKPGEFGFKCGHKPWNKGTHVQTNTGKTHFKKGQKPAHWKGGISRIQSRIYASPQNKLWREEVFKRDNWTCQTCGFRGDLEAHHIIPMNQLLNRVMIAGISDDDRFNLALSIPEMFDLANGLTLCKSCHYSKHKRRIRCKK
jgi:hypothetical protein